MLSNVTTNDLWVFGDLRSRHLLDLSLKVVAKAATLAREIDGRVVLFMLTPSRDHLMTVSDGDACVVATEVTTDAMSHGADEILLIENPNFATPAVHLFAGVLPEIILDKAPRLVMFALTDFGRDLAARVAATVRAGLMADCVAFRPDERGHIVGLCPAWGGEVMAEITYAEGHGTGFATVQPQGGPQHPLDERRSKVTTLAIGDPPPVRGMRLCAANPAPVAVDTLEKARTVVVGGAGLGTMDNFGQLRELAAALAGQVGATRPPVLNHWISEDRLIGQTGKTVRPQLLISVGTSGAIQYTAGIMDAGTIVAINRDPAASIFRLADIGVVGDATTLLPLIIKQVRQTVMRQLADDICGADTTQLGKSGLGQKIRELRKAQGWSNEQLAAATGQTPEFIADVENGTLSPPVAFMLRLAGAYGVDPGTFLRDEEKKEIRDQRAQAYVNRTKQYSYQTLTSGADHDHLRAFMVTIEPHHDHKPVAYKHDGEEFIFVMDGELQFTLGNRAQRLKKGESIHFHANTPHKLKSLSAEETRCLVMLYTP